jgi:hypothetical protein
MWRKSIVGFLVFLAAASAAPAEDAFELRIDGRILRKATGKLVLTLSAFELDGQDTVTLEKRGTRETKRIRIGSVYEDSCYTEALPPAEYDSFDPDAWVAYVTWKIPYTNDELNRRLTSIHEQQNVLRHAMGHALLNDDPGSSRITSRSTLNKIEKYHRLGNRIAAEIMKKWNREETNPFFFPVRIQVGYNPFGQQAAHSVQQAPLLQAREAIYWELNRLLTQQYGIDEVVVPLVYNAPGTIRHILPLGEQSPEELDRFSPQLYMSSETLDGAVYLLRQDFVADLKDTLRTREYLAPFVTDRPVLDAFVNEGKVTAVVGNKLALTFIPPFAVAGEKLYLVVDPEKEQEIPLVVESVFDVEGYSLSAPLPPEQVARAKAGMTVRRHK